MTWMFVVEDIAIIRHLQVICNQNINFILDMCAKTILRIALFMITDMLSAFFYL